MTEQDIPEQLIERLQEEKRQEALRRKERNEAHLYMNIQVYTEDSFMGHKGNDLFDPEKAVSKTFKVKKQNTVREAMEIMAEQMKAPLGGMRLWPIISRANETLRPSTVVDETGMNCPVVDMCEGGNPWQVFLELALPDSPDHHLPPIDKDRKWCPRLMVFKVSLTRRNRSRLQTTCYYFSSCTIRRISLLRTVATST